MLYKRFLFGMNTALLISYFAFGQNILIALGLFLVLGIEVFRGLSVGTKSVLIGAHCFALHWLFVARAWIHLYGWPLDPRIWAAFLLHDIGYLGKPNMDGAEGERHVELGAKVMHWMFDDWIPGKLAMSWKWHDFCLYHSRHYAKQAGAPISKLCLVDKLAFTYQCRWWYLLTTRLTGEIDEYLSNQKYWSAGLNRHDSSKWYDDLCVWVREYVAEHIDGKEDTWTVTRKAA